MIHEQRVHDDLLGARRRPRPVLRPAERLRHPPQRAGASVARVADPGPVGAEVVEAGGDVGQGRGQAVVAAAVAVRGVAGGVPLVGEGEVGGDGVGVRHDDVGAGGVLLEVEVVAVEHEGDGVVGVEAFDGRVGDAGGVEGVAPAVGLVGRVPEQQGFA